MIEITDIVPPETGWPIVFHCPMCKCTTIVLSVYAAKPSRGDYLFMEEFCLDNPLHTWPTKEKMKW